MMMGLGGMVGWRSPFLLSLSVLPVTGAVFGWLEELPTSTDDAASEDGDDDGSVCELLSRIQHPRGFAILVARALYCGLSHRSAVTYTRFPFKTDNFVRLARR